VQPFRIITSTWSRLYEHIIATSTLAIPVMIINETSLSYLGWAFDRPRSVGGVVAGGANHPTVAQAPWLLLPAWS